jgi:hypothetical protein
LALLFYIKEVIFPDFSHNLVTEQTSAKVELLMVVKIEFMVFWFLMLCSVVVGYQCFAGLKMEAAWSSETLESNHHTTWCNNPESYEFC